MKDTEQRIFDALCGHPVVHPAVIGGERFFLRTLRVREAERIRTAFPDEEESSGRLRTIGYIAASLCEEDGTGLITDPIEFAKNMEACDPLWGTLNLLWDFVSDINFLNSIAIESARKNWSQAEDSPPCSEQPDGYSDSHQST